jgi:mRNA interferase MazF
MAYQTGEVVLVNYPYTDLTTVKARPAVVVSGARYQSEQPDVMLAALTSNVSAATGSLDYVLQDWTAAGLRLPTAYKPVLVTLEPSLIVHRIGHLSSRDFMEIQTRLRLALDLT